VTANASKLFECPIVRGSGADKGENCSVELLGLAIYGNYKHRYTLPCIDNVAQGIVVQLNDALPLEVLQSRRWRLLVARLSQCHKHGNDRAQLRMIAWCLRSLAEAYDDVDSRSLEIATAAVDEVIEGQNGLRDLRVTMRELGRFNLTELAWSIENHLRNISIQLLSLLEEEQVEQAASYAAAIVADLHRGKIASICDCPICDRTHGGSSEERDLAIDAALEWLDQYFTAWAKIAVDEGEALADEQEEEYAEFASQLEAILGAEERERERERRESAGED
jgi:hypothetical protein